MAGLASVSQAAENRGEQAPASAEGESFTFAAVGDTLQVRPQLPTDDPGFLAVTRIIQSADAAFANGEMVLLDVRSFKGYPAAETGGGYTLGSPEVARDLKQQGFGLIGRANNHATDWGMEGMAETDRLFAEQGIVTAGTGGSLPLARAPRYLPTRRGRVALVSAATTFSPMSEAAPAIGQASGRPGVNMIRTAQFVGVEQSTIDALRRGYGEAPTAVVARTADRGSAPSGRTDQLNIFGVTFEASARPGVRYEMNAADLADNLRAVRQAKGVADFVVFTVHAHESASGRFNDNEQAAFVPTLAHAAIDAGADVYVGHGPHILRGIEIYKGKPIFYGLGNYFFQLDLLEGIPQVPAVANERTEQEQMGMILNRGFANPAPYQSVVAVSRFNRGAVCEIRLYPIDLGVDLAPRRRGVPRLAGPEMAAKIIERMRVLSAPYGTKVAARGSVGVVSVAPCA